MFFYQKYNEMNNSFPKFDILCVGFCLSMNDIKWGTGKNKKIAIFPPSLFIYFWYLKSRRHGRLRASQASSIKKDRERCVFFFSYFLFYFHWKWKGSHSCVTFGRSWGWTLWKQFSLTLTHQQHFFYAMMDGGDRWSPSYEENGSPAGWQESKNERRWWNKCQRTSQLQWSQELSFVQHNRAYIQQSAKMVVAIFISI